MLVYLDNRPSFETTRTWLLSIHVMLCFHSTISYVLLFTYQQIFFIKKIIKDFVI